MPAFLLAEPIREYFKKEHGVVSVFLFGSYAKGQARAGSDVDLALLLDRAIPESEYLSRRLTWMHDLSSLVTKEVDIVFLNEAGPVLTHQVLLYGKVLFERDPRETTAFKARSMVEYVDWLPYQNRLNQSVLQHFKRGVTRG